jgi:hypothetical protein
MGRTEIRLPAHLKVPGYIEVLARGPDVVVGGVALGRADREVFARVFFQACADADDWAEGHGEATVPPA